MSDVPSIPWRLTCAWCPWYVTVNARGAHGADPGSGYEAALLMQAHVESHGHTWREYLVESDEPKALTRRLQ